MSTCRLSKEITKKADWMKRPIGGAIALFLAGMCFSTATAGLTAPAEERSTRTLDARRPKDRIYATMHDVPTSTIPYASDREALNRASRRLFERLILSIKMAGDPRKEVEGLNEYDRLMGDNARKYPIYLWIAEAVEWDQYTQSEAYMAEWKKEDEFERKAGPARADFLELRKYYGIRHLGGYTCDEPECELMFLKRDQIKTTDPLERKRVARAKMQRMADEAEKKIKDLISSTALPEFLIRRANPTGQLEARQLMIKAAVGSLESNEAKRLKNTFENALEQWRDRPTPIPIEHVDELKQTRGDEVVERIAEMYRSPFIPDKYKALYRDSLRLLERDKDKAFVREWWRKVGQPIPKEALDRIRMQRGEEYIEQMMRNRRQLEKILGDPNGR